MGANAPVGFPYSQLEQEYWLLMGAPSEFNLTSLN